MIGPVCGSARHLSDSCPCSAERLGISLVFPTAYVLFCVFHVLQGNIVCVLCCVRLAFGPMALSELAPLEAARCEALHPIPPYHHRPCFPQLGNAPLAANWAEIPRLLRPFSPSLSNCYTWMRHRSPWQTCSRCTTMFWSTSRLLPLSENGLRSTLVCGMGYADIGASFTGFGSRCRVTPPTTARSL